MILKISCLDKSESKHYGFNLILSISPLRILTYKALLK